MLRLCLAALACAILVGSTEAATVNRPGLGPSGEPLGGVRDLIVQVARRTEVQWLVIASRSTPEEAIALAQSYGSTLGAISVAQSNNGQFAIVAGYLGAAKAKANLEALKAVRLIPDDSFLTFADKFRVVVWDSGPDFRNTEVIQRCPSSEHLAQLAA